MSGGMPELGSKISLISKADIRYEGRLYTVDPQECTIALSNVRSFGTEDRETQFQIAPQSQIYDYILFRGSDIKDIRVINNSLPHPNDPAIMQVQLPNGQHVMPHFSMPSMNPQQVPPMGTSGTYGNPFGTMSGLGAIGGATGAGTVPSLAPGAGVPGPFMIGGSQQPVPSQQKAPQGQQSQIQQKQPSCNTTDTNNLGTSSLLTTVDSIGLNLNNSNTAHSSNNPNSNTNINNSCNSNHNNNAINNVGLLGIGLGIGGSGGLLSNIGLGIGGGVVGNSSTASATASTTKKLSLTNATALNDHKDQDMLAGASRSTTPISLISRKSPSADIGVQVNPNQQHQQHHHSTQNQNQHHQQQPQQQQEQQLHPNHQNNAVGGGQSRDAGHKRQQNHQNQRGGNQQRNNDNYRSGRILDNYNNMNHYNQRNNNQGGNPNRNNWNTHRGNMPNNNNNSMRNRGGGQRSNMRNIMSFRSANGPGIIQKASRNPIKFEQDFDFEQANTKFEELRSQLSKLKVGDEPKSEQMNGETDKKDDSGNETGAGEHEPEEEEISVGYDKTKSFFDNISCETAQDRTKNKNYDWRQERKLNSETFGVSSTRRGGYRGRGNYYNNRNMGNYNNGGYNNRGYRGNNYRNRSNNRNKMHINRDGSTSNGAAGNNNVSTNTTANNNNNNVASASANLKNQTQQPSTHGSASNHTTNNTTPATTSKTMSSTGLQETNNQPQMTAVSAGQ